MLFLFHGFFRHFSAPFGGFHKGQIPSLDGIRAVSILIVLAGHVGISDRIPGGFGVMIFFFLSGYLITTLFAREWDRTGQTDLIDFYRRRFLRLFPPLLLCLSICYLLTYSGMANGNLDPAAIVSHLFYFNNYYLLLTDQPEQVTAGLTPLWSLSVEEHFYLFFPFLFVQTARGRAGPRVYIGLLLAVLTWRFVRVIGAGDTEWAIYLRSDTRIDSMLFGCLLSVLHWQSPAFQDNAQSRQWRTVILLVLAGAAIFASILIRDPLFRSTLRYSIQGVALMVVFHFAVTSPHMALFRPLNWTLVRMIGVYSYNIYLWHYVVIRLLEKHGIFASSYPAFVLAVVTITLCIAAAVYHGVELPLRRLRDRRAGQPFSTQADAREAV